MVVLRNMSHYEYRSSKPTPGPAERQKDKAGPQERRRSPRRRTSTTKTTVVREATRDRVPTPLAEKKNEENTRDVAARPKASPTAEASPTRVSSSPPRYDASRPRTRRRGSGKEKTIKGKGPKGARSLEVERSWRENVSPPLKGRELDDDVPMIIECWQ